MSERIEPGVILVDPTGHRADETESHISPRLSDLRVFASVCWTIRKRTLKSSCGR